MTENVKIYIVFLIYLSENKFNNIKKDPQYNKIFF